MGLQEQLLVYTTDYDSTHNHFDRISSDILDVQKVVKKISDLEKKQSAPWTWTADGSMTDTTVTDTAVLNNMKSELGVPADVKVGDVSGLDVASSVAEALNTDGDHRGVNGVGFTKAQGLDGTDLIFGASYYNTGYNNQ